MNKELEKEMIFWHTESNMKNSLYFIRKERDLVTLPELEDLIHETRSFLNKLKEERRIKLDRK